MSLLTYANEKLSLGVHELATHPGRIKERLISAFHPSLAQVPDTDLPPEAKELWGKVWKQVTAQGGTAESGTYQSSINALSENEAVELARNIVTVQAMVKAALG
jgi:hypothetical protein